MRGKLKVCPVCHKEHNKPGLFCSYLCVNTKVRKKKKFSEMIDSGTARKRLLKEKENKCERCGWREESPFHKVIPLQLHHKDGNRKNNSRENLEILCPNCHSLTENFMSYGKKHKK